MSTRAWAFAAAIVLALGGALRAESPSDGAGWWVEHYGVLETRDRPRLKAARAIFERVLAAADKNGKRFPQLVLLRARAGPFALALPDGTVLLTPDAIELCYRGVPAAVGDARLAFVLAHELAHLARDDFWHAFAADGATGAREPAERTREKELQADSYGLLYMTMAGYAPESVLRQNAVFLDEWQRRAAATVGGSHPSTQERAAGMRAGLTAIGDDLDLFRSGVRLMQLERYEDALLFLQPFQERFPSREVFNDVGLCNYQLALRALAGCDPEAALRFRLPARLDPATQVRRITPRGVVVACPLAATFERRADEAVRRLEHAAAADRAYLKAPLNLASALILKDEPARALAAVEDALKVAPESAEARNVKAVALYLYGRRAGVETTESALRILRDLRTERPADRDAAYNLAALLDERERGAAAREAWEDFLKAEPEGVYADQARRRLKREPWAATPRPQPPVRSPIPLGRLTHDGERLLKGLHKRTLDLGAVKGVLYRSERLSALELDYSIEVAEEEIAALPFSQILAKYGPPRRESEGPGSRIAVYRGLAFDVVNGNAVRRITFAE